jgi:ParB-like chromosome segregation protein Spo0J
MILVSALLVAVLVLAALARVVAATGGAEPARRLTSAKRRMIVLKLSQITIDARRFSHRDDLSDESIEDLVRSIVEEGALVPPTVWRDPTTDTWFTVAGTRRVLAHQKAVRDNMDRRIFHDDMELLCVEVFDCDEVDLQLVSVADNAHRRDFTAGEKIATAGEWSRQRMPIARCAKAMRVSESQYRRWVLIAENPWMVDLIEQECIDPSFAAKILELARSNNRLTELQQDLEDWVAQTRLDIKRLVQRRADAHKKVPEGEQKVRHYLTRQLQDRWLECVRQGQRLDDEVGIRFGILFDPERRTLSIPPLEADARTNPADLVKVLEELADAPAKVAQFIRQIRIDHELRARAVPQTAADKSGLLDSLGLGDLAREVEQKRQQQEAAEAGEDDPRYDERPSRGDQDIAPSIDDLPTTDDHHEEPERHG